MANTTRRNRHVLTLIVVAVVIAGCSQTARVVNDAEELTAAVVDDLSGQQPSEFSYSGFDVAAVVPGKSPDEVVAVLDARTDMERLDVVIAERLRSYSVTSGRFAGCRVIAYASGKELYDIDQGIGGVVSSACDR